MRSIVRFTTLPAMAVLQKNALGAFPDLYQLELALSKLRETGFPMQQVTTIAQQIEPEVADRLAEFDTTLSEPHESFAPDRRSERIQQRAAGGGAVGGAVGTALAGLATLTFPVGGGALLLAGMLGGAFYGAVSGGIIGGSIGINITDEQAQHFSDLLDRGYYLVTVKGAPNEIAMAENTLTAANIQDWTLFKEA
jgi:outer membrane lipoprotein SlyB